MLIYQSLFHTVDDRPEEKYFNRHVKETICAAGPEVWRDLGVQLLQEKDIIALDMIKNSKAELAVRCSEMFKLWLKRQPKASWRDLIEALKQIHQNKLAFDAEGLLSVTQTSEEAGTMNPILMADQPTLTQHNGMSSACVGYGI